MPSAVHARNTLTFQKWRGPKQNRYSSTGQELKTVQDDERIAAMLHGKKKNGGKDQPSKAPNPSSHQSPTPSHHKGRSSVQSQQWINRSRKQAQQGHTDIVGGKRKATASLSQRPARRQRGNDPDLKDEAYVRSTMHIPTPQEYPDAPQDIFKNPKSSIYNIAQGLAECRSEITALAHGAYQCTAYYTSAMHNQVVVGEGRTKASRSTS